MTGAKGGLYHKFAMDLKEVYERQTGHMLTVRTSAGSEANEKVLVTSAADFAILQSGAMPLDNVALLGALYPEVVHVVVRKD